LETNNPDGEEVIVLEASNEEGEALNLVAEIRDLVERRGYLYMDLAVLYRCNFQSRVIEEVFSQHKIPYHIANGLSFYQRREVKILLDYLRLILVPDSSEGDEGLLGVINIPNRYIGKKFVKELEEFASGNDLHLYPALRSIPVELPYVRKNVREFTNLLDPLMEDAQNLDPAEVIHLLRIILDLDRHVTDEDLPSPDDVKIQNIDQLQLAATRFKNIESFLQYTDAFEDESVVDNKEGVSLSSVHKAKGREYPVVFVVGMIENLLPSKKGDLPEERRICFVAISRAMKLLYLSHTHSFLNQPSKRSPIPDEILGIKTPEQPLR